MPAVSVIIPTYNRAHVLGRAIESVLAQSYADFELIVVDDGSRDRTEELVAALAHPKIRYLKLPRNRGQNAALNAGVRSAAGGFCAFLDSDDQWLPSFLQRIMPCFERDPRYGCAYSWAGVRNRAGGLDTSKRFTLSGEIYAQALAQGYVSHMITLVVKRHLLFEAGLFDESFVVCQDDDICLRLAALTPFCLVEENLAVIHSDAGGQLTGHRAHYADGFRKLVGKFEEEILTHCGASALGRHYERCGDLFWLAANRSGALAAYERAAQFSRSLPIRTKRWAVLVGLEADAALRFKRLGAKLVRGRR